MAKKRAFVKYTKSGKIIPGSLIITTEGGYPINGLYQEVPTNICCDTDIPGTITTSPKGWVGYTKSGEIIPGSLIIGKSYPKNGVWKEVLVDLCCEATTTTTTQPPGPVLGTVLMPDSFSYVPSGLFDINFAGMRVGFWMKVDSSQGTTNSPSIICNIGYDSSTGTAYEMLYLNRGSDELCYLYDGGSSGITYPLSSYLDQWVYVAIVGSLTGDAALWINGGPVGFSTTAPSQPTPPGLPIVFGSDYDASFGFYGKLADFMITNTNAPGEDIRFPTSAPRTPSAGTTLSLFQGSSLGAQLTDNGVFSLISGIATNVSYDTDSPYVGYQGSVKFG